MFSLQPEYAAASNPALKNIQTPEKILLLQALVLHREVRGQGRYSVPY